MPSSACKKCALDRKSTRLNSSHGSISYAVFCLQKQLDGAEAPYIAQQPTQPSGHFSYRRIAFFFFNDPATPEISPLSPHGALPISSDRRQGLSSRSTLLSSAAQAAGCRRSE